MSKKYLDSTKNFLAIAEKGLYEYNTSRVVVQQLPYEYTSSYLQGSSKGPSAMVAASQFVELYDEELDLETYQHCGGICTLAPLNFKNKVDKKAVEQIRKSTKQLLLDKKFVVSLGAEHTVTLGLVQAHRELYPDLCVLQLDAHSDLRLSYHGNPYSHASVMARIHEEGLSLTQIGIRAQCIEESQMIKESDNIHTFYAHQIRRDAQWMKKALQTLGQNIYLSIDADGFDPSVAPAVGTAEPNGLFWDETLQFLKLVFEKKNVVGFDIVEVAPMKNAILTEYSMAKLAYRLMGYKFCLK